MKCFNNCVKYFNESKFNMQVAIGIFVIIVIFIIL